MNNTDVACKEDLATDINKPAQADMDVLQTLLPAIANVQKQVDTINHAVSGIGSIEALMNTAQVEPRNLTAKNSETKKLYAIIQNLSDGIIITCSQGQIEAANSAAERLLNVPDCASACSIEVLFRSAGIPAMNMTPQGEKRSGEFVAKTNHGKILHIKWFAVDHSVITLLQDISTTTELDKAQSDFLAAMSHELRTPLTIIQNAISNMIAGVTGKLSPKMNDYLGAMDKDCHRLSHLINDMLDMAKLEAGKMPLNRSVSDAAVLMRKAIKSFSAAAASKNIVIEYRGSTSVSVYADAARISQVLQNLIQNALKHTPDGGLIILDSQETPSDLVVSVQDTGTGIAPELQKNIFNKFYQISRQVGPGYNGSGLGLALSNEIVAIHGGHMWLKSQPGLGSKFYFSLPKTKNELMLRNHISSLIEKSQKQERQFAMILIKISYPNGAQQVYHEGIMESLLGQCKDIALMNGDLAVRVNESEIFLVLTRTGKRYLKYVKNNLCNRINDLLLRIPAAHDFTPMAGAAVFPTDSSEIDGLLAKVRHNINRI